MRYLGFDIGTTSIKCVIFDYDIRKIVDSMIIPNNTWIISAENWERKQNPDKIFRIVNNIILYAISKYNSIAGIGLTGQMHGILYVDNKGRAVSDLYTWQDSRGNLLYDKKYSYAQKVSQLVSFPL